MSSIELHQKQLVDSSDLLTSRPNKMRKLPNQKDDHVTQIGKQTFSELTDAEDINRLRTMHPRCTRIRILVDKDKVLYKLIHIPLINDFNLKISQVIGKKFTITFNKKNGSNIDVDCIFTKTGDYFIGVDNYCVPGEYLASMKLEILPLNEKYNVLMQGTTISFDPYEA